MRISQPKKIQVMKCKSSDCNDAQTGRMEPQSLLLQLGLLGVLIASTAVLLVSCKSMNSSVPTGIHSMATPVPGLFSWPGFQVSPGIHLMTIPTAFTGISPDNDDTGNEVDFGTNIGNFGTDDFALSFWIRQFPGATSEYACFEKREICQASISLWEILIGGGNIGWAEVPPGHLATYICSDNNENVSTLVSKQAINDGIFHHVVLTRNGKAVSYYIDGAIDNSKTMDGIANVNNSGMFRAGQSVCVRPGVDGFDGTRPFVGELDRIDLFDRALSATEISAFHRAGRGDHSAVEIAAPPPATEISNVFVAKNSIQEKAAETNGGLLATGAWSETVVDASNGGTLRGRLLVYDQKSDNAANHARVYLELQHVFAGAWRLPFEVYFPNGLHFEMKDQRNEPIPKTLVVMVGPRPSSDWIPLPDDSTVRLRADDFLSGPETAPEGLEILVPGGCWIVPPKATNEFFLSATYTPSHDHPSPRGYPVWQGTLKLPAVRIPVEKKIAGTDNLFKTIVDTNSGQYVTVTSDRKTLILKDRFHKIIWSTNVVEYLKKFEFPEEKNHGEKRIANVEILKGEIIISVGRDFATVNKRTGEVTYKGAD